MKIAVTIGRFQPFHQGHEHLLKTALAENDYLIVVLGSSNRHRSVKNPFSVAERKGMILDWVQDNRKSIPNGKNRIFFVESPDNLYKEWSWKSEIVRRVNDVLPDDTLSLKVRLYGHMKDDSSYYLNEFPEWEFRAVDNFHEIDATGIRECYFEDGIISSYYLPVSTEVFMREFKRSETYADLVEDWRFFKKEKRLFGGYPFPETLNFMCSDAVVVCKGHILLIKRKEAPGKNSWALPGGFKNKDETFEQAAIRELLEEANLRIPEKVLKGSIKDVKMFDDPRRSLGIPRVSMAYYIEVNTDPDGTLPDVRPASDAKDAKWVNLADALATNLFEDHLDIIRWFV